MDDFFHHLKSENREVFDTFRTIADLSEDMFTHSPQTLTEFLKVFFKKHGICLQEENESRKVDGSTQTEEFKNEDENNLWNLENVADEVALVAKKNLQENGFVYDSNTGLYYDHKLQCYYNPEYKLYYYQQTGAYYYYDFESQSLKYYCSTSSESNNVGMKSNNGSQQHETTKSTDINDTTGYQLSSGAIATSSQPTETSENASNTTQVKVNSTDSEKEDGECSDESCGACSPSPMFIEAGPKAFEPNHAEHIAPCIRVLVKSTSLTSLDAGTLFIVTCTGGTLGREGDHEVLIPDKLVSKLHSTFRYVYRDGSYFYEMFDEGSKNGTFLNGKRLSDPLIKSDPFEVSHGSIITVGSTDLLCHIHPKDEICKECEGYTPLKMTEVAGYELTKPDYLSLRQKHRNEVLAMRKKFGVNNAVSVKCLPGYEDRSEIRRKTKGSSHPCEKTQMTSTDVAIDKNNKGFSLMTKMGWVEGSALGKNVSGITEPVNLERTDGTLGLGCEVPKLSEITSSKESKRIAIWKRTLDRYKNSK